MKKNVDELEGAEVNKRSTDPQKDQDRDEKRTRSLDRGPVPRSGRNVSCSRTRPGNKEEVEYILLHRRNQESLYQKSMKSLLDGWSTAHTYSIIRQTETRNFVTVHRSRHK